MSPKSHVFAEIGPIPIALKTVVKMRFLTGRIIYRKTS